MQAGKEVEGLRQEAATREGMLCRQAAEELSVLEAKVVQVNVVPTLLSAPPPF